MRRVIILSLALFVSLAQAQVARDADTLIALLKSESIADRTQAARQVFGAGIKNPALYEQIAITLESGLGTIEKNSPRLDEMSWLTKALASSGDIKYMPIVERAVNSGAGSLPRHAKDAKKILIEQSRAGRPYLLYTSVPVLTEKQSESCRYITQRMCETSRSAERCIAQHQVNAIESGGNAIVLMHTSSRSVGFGPFGGDTSMLANYYTCE